MEDFKFDLQLFAEGEEPVSEPTADNTPLEQPETDSSAEEGSQEPQQQDFDWSLDEEGNVVFDDSVFDDHKDSEGAEPPAQEEQPKANEPQKFPVKINGVEQMVTIEELQRGYMQQADLTK